METQLNIIGEALLTMAIIGGVVGIIITVIGILYLRS